MENNTEEMNASGKFCQNLDCCARGKIGQSNIFVHSRKRPRYRCTVAMIVNNADIFPDNWIYLHDPDIIAGRIQNFKNWSPNMVPDPSKTCLGLEYFCFEGDGSWTSSDVDLVKLGGKELVKLKLCKPEEILGGVVVRQPKAYPVYDDEYKIHVRTIRDYLEAHATNMQLVGCNGMHHYNN